MLKEEEHLRSSQSDENVYARLTLPNMCVCVYGVTVCKRSKNSAKKSLSVKPKEQKHWNFDVGIRSPAISNVKTDRIYGENLKYGPALSPTYFILQTKIMWNYSSQSKVWKCTTAVWWYKV